MIQEGAAVPLSLQQEEELEQRRRRRQEVATMVQGLSGVVERFGWWGGADLVMRCGEEAWPCHRAVLAAASPVFERGLAGTTLEAAAGEWRVEASPAAARALLDFMYHQEDAGRQGEVEVLAAELLHLADLYHLQELKEACSEALLRQMVPEDAVVVLAIVDRYLTEDQGVTKERVVSFIRRNEEMVVASDSWDTMVEDFPHLVKEIVNLDGFLKSRVQ